MLLLFLHSDCACNGCYCSTYRHFSMTGMGVHTPGEDGTATVTTITGAVMYTMITISTQTNEVVVIIKSVVLTTIV